MEESRWQTIGFPRKQTKTVLLLEEKRIGGTARGIEYLKDEIRTFDEQRYSERSRNLALKSESRRLGLVFNNGNSERERLGR